MIIIKISGGIGNQFFQYAFAKALEFRRGIEVKIDRSHFDMQNKNITKRIFLLDNFKLSLKIAKREDFKKIGVPFPPENGFWGKIKKAIFKVEEYFRPDGNKKIIEDTTFGFDDSIFKIRDNSYVSGIWPSPRYFKSIEDIVFKDIMLKNHLSKNAEFFLGKIQEYNSVSIHIRRGDYLKYPNKFGLCSLEYYEKAVEKIKQSVISPVFFVFSDDINYAKENLKIGHNVFYVSGLDVEDYEELVLMSKCKHNIMANSTFSWWGAWLNKNRNKIVIAPKMLRKDDKNTSDFIPQEWNWIRM